MSHEIRTRLDPDGAPSDAIDRFEEWREQFRQILEGRSIEYRTEPERWDGERPEYDEFRVHFGDERQDG